MYVCIYICVHIFHKQTYKSKFKINKQQTVALPCFTEKTINKTCRSLKLVRSWPVCLEHPGIRGIQVMHLTVLKVVLYTVNKSLEWKKKKLQVITFLKKRLA